MVKDIYSTPPERSAEIGYAVVICRSQADTDQFAVITFNLSNGADTMAIVRRSDIVAIRDALSAELARDEN